MQQNAASITSSGENFLAALEAFFDRKGPEIMSGGVLIKAAIELLRLFGFQKLL